MAARSTLLAAGLLVGGLAVGLSGGPVTPLHADQSAKDDASSAVIELPALGARRDDASVIGVSSGGYMASQMAVAWPARFAGLGVIAAGPWACARGSLGRALGQCMFTTKGPVDLDAIDARRQSYLERELVGTPEQLATLRAYTWHGGADKVVAPSIGQSLAQQLSAWLADPEQQLRVVVDAEAAHGWPIGSETPDDDHNIDIADCAEGGGTHLLDCERQVAQEALDWIHGPAPDGNGEHAGRLVRFDQGDFDARGLADVGYLFIPDACESGGCPVSVALHGCDMGAEEGDESFVRRSGLNPRAAAEGRLVLYPQAEASMANPRGCWDWWGFSESSWQLDPLHDSRQGRQLGALMQMLDRLQSAKDD